MPRDSNGNYSLPLPPVVSNTLIEADWANTTDGDLAQAMTDSLSRSGLGGMLGVFKLTDGSEGSPGLQFINRSNLGMYRNNIETDNDLRFTVNGTDMMRLFEDSLGGRVIQYWNDTVGEWQNLLTDSGGGSQVPVNVGTDDGQTLRWNLADTTWEATSDIKILDSGFVGIGDTVDPIAPLDVNIGLGGGLTTILARGGDTRRQLQTIGYDTNGVDDLQAQLMLEFNTSNLSSVNFYRGSNNITGSIGFSTSGIEHMRVNNGGGVSIGTESTLGVLNLGNGADNAFGMITFNNSADQMRTAFSRIDGTTPIFGFVDRNGREILSYSATSTDGSQYIAFQTNNTAEAMRIDGGGNVGIGVTDPAARGKGLVVADLESLGDVYPLNAVRPNAGALEDLTGVRFAVGSAQRPATMGAYLESSSAVGIKFGVSQSSVLNYAARITSAGLVGIGETVPYSALHVTKTSPPNDVVGVLESDSGATYLNFRGPNSGSTQVRMGMRGNGLSLMTNSTERIFIDSTGRTLFGTIGQYPPATSALIHSDSSSISSMPALALTGNNTTANQTGALDISVFSTVVRNAVFFRSPNGEAGSITVTNLTTQYNTGPSDYRMKENVTPLTGVLDKVLALNPVSYNFKVSPEETYDGFIAHEVGEQFPDLLVGEYDAVTEEGDILPQKYDKMGLVTYLTAAIQELTARVEALEA